MPSTRSEACLYLGYIVILFEQSSATQYLGGHLLYRLMHMMHLQHWEVSCPFLASIMVDQWEPGWYLKEWDSTEHNMKARVQLRSTPTPPLPISVLSLCHQGDIAQGAPVFFFNQVWRLSLAFAPSIILEAVMFALKCSFFSYYMSQISLYQTNDYLVMIQTKEYIEMHIQTSWKGGLVVWDSVKRNYQFNTHVCPVCE